MDFNIINRQPGTLQPSGGNAPDRSGTLPTGLRDHLDGAIRSSMQGLSIAPGALVDLPMPASVVDIALPPGLAVPQPSAKLPPVPAAAPAAAPSADAAWQFTMPRQVTSPLPDIVIAPPAPTKEQAMAAEGRRILEEVRQRVDADGKVSLKEFFQLRKVAERPEVIAYRHQQAESFEHNYLPSDGGGVPRDMTHNDALRELYTYADDLPKKTSLETLRGIADGTVQLSRRAPQLVAAAQYLVDHPDEWTQVTGKEGDERIKRAGLCDALSHNIRLDDGQLKAVDTLQKNADDFFDGRKFDRDKLATIIADPASKRENVAAAKELLRDPVLFGMLDNAQHGHKSTAWRKSDDGQIGRKDLSRFLENVNRTPEPDPAEPARSVVTQSDAQAVKAMVKGQENAPESKTVKGGALKKVVSGVMKGLAIWEKIGSAALGAVAALKIPLVSQVAAAGSMVSNAIAGGLDVGRTAINGGNVKAAAAQAGMSFASNAISVATAPGAGKAATVAGGEVAKVAVKAAAKEAAKEAGKEIAKEVGGDVVKSALPPDRRPA